MSKCCFKSQLERKDISFDIIKKIVGHAGGDLSFFFFCPFNIHHEAYEKKKKSFNIMNEMKKEVKATCEM